MIYAIFQEQHYICRKYKGLHKSVNFLRFSIEISVAKMLQ